MSPTATRETGAVVFSGMIVEVSVDARWTSDPAAQLLEVCNKRTVSGDVMPKFCHEHRKTATVQVFDVWSGDVPERVKVTTPFEGPMCGIPFQVGQTYLFYAGSRPDGSLSDSLCSRTTLLSDAQADVDELGNPVVNYVSKARARFRESDPGK